MIFRIPQNAGSSWIAAQQAAFQGSSVPWSWLVNYQVGDKSTWGTMQCGVRFITTSVIIKIFLWRETECCFDILRVTHGAHINVFKAQWIFVIILHRWHENNIFFSFVIYFIWTEVKRIICVYSVQIRNRIWIYAIKVDLICFNRARRLWQVCFYSKSKRLMCEEETECSVILYL
jgi:hypothetical protein